VFGGGAANFYVDEPAAVGQAVQTRLALWRGEWSFDTSQGTPYLDAVIGKHTTQDADQTIQAEVLDTVVPLSTGGTANGVSGIAKYESNRDTVKRSLSVTMTIDTIYGPTEVDLQNFVNY
jgi:hypothetical protein